MDYRGDVNLTQSCIDKQVLVAVVSIVKVTRRGLIVKFAWPTTTRCPTGEAARPVGVVKWVPPVFSAMNGASAAVKQVWVVNIVTAVCRTTTTSHLRAASLVAVSWLVVVKTSRSVTPPVAIACAKPMSREESVIDANLDSSHLVLTIHLAAFLASATVIHLSVNPPLATI